MPLTAADLVADARRQIREIDADSFHADAGGCTLIDVREPAEFETGHIARAVNIPRGTLEFRSMRTRRSPTSATRRSRTSIARSCWSAAPVAAPRWPR